MILLSGIMILVCLFMFLLMADYLAQIGDNLPNGC